MYLKKIFFVVVAFVKLTWLDQMKGNIMRVRMENINLRNKKPWILSLLEYVDKEVTVPINFSLVDDLDDLSALEAII